ncbi:MAG: hypothetical protein KF713_05100 [Turneriella sp.]|nr:hypothetical protein [Turneriella sp.]
MRINKNLRAFFVLLLTTTLLASYCTSLTLTNRNATEPVMAGKINNLGAKPEKGNAIPHTVMEPVKTWHVVFLFFIYLWKDSTEQNFQDLADAQYALTVEKTRCTRRIQNIEYNTYSHFSLIFTSYMNTMKAESDGTVKCAR